MKDFNEAIYDFDKAIRLDPERGYYYAHLGEMDLGIYTNRSKAHLELG